MATTRAGKSVTRLGRKPAPLAGRVILPSPSCAYAVPYFTKHGSDTEYLLSNPNATTNEVRLFVFGRGCRVVAKRRVVLKPDCTTRFRVRSVSPDMAGFAVILSKLPLLCHILYWPKPGTPVLGGELAGPRSARILMGKPVPRAYAFGYRSFSLASSPVPGVVCISNPTANLLSGQVAFFDQSCRALRPIRLAVRPGCTREIPFPKDRYGYCRVDTSDSAVVNVLHLDPTGRLIAGAELITDENQVSSRSTTPTGKKRVLFDDTHQCRPGLVGDWTRFESALRSAGLTVSHLSGAITPASLSECDVLVVAVARTAYNVVEKKAIASFVGNGGGLLMVQDFGNAPWSVPMRDLLNTFSTSDENNLIFDETNNVGDPGWVLFEPARNYHPHTILTGINAFHVNAAASLTGGTLWETIVETDDDSVPSRRPVLIARNMGSGRLLAFGDSNTWADGLIADLDNQRLGVRSIQWLLQRI